LLGVCTQSGNIYNRARGGKMRSGNVVGHISELVQSHDGKMASLLILNDEGIYEE
jgi:hypothetical protein